MGCCANTTDVKADAVNTKAQDKVFSSPVDHKQSSGFKSEKLAGDAIGSEINSKKKSTFGGLIGKINKKISEVEENTKSMKMISEWYKKFEP